jgi:hypothetical protein
MFRILRDGKKPITLPVTDGNLEFIKEWIEPSDRVFVFADSSRCTPLSFWSELNVPCSLSAISGDDEYKLKVEFSKEKATLSCDKAEAFALIIGTECLELGDVKQTMTIKNTVVKKVKENLFEIVPASADYESIAVSVSPRFVKEFKSV